MGNFWANDNTNIQNYDIIICFIPDTTNIDSKQITLISNQTTNDDKQLIWNSLYKKDFTV